MSSAAMGEGVYKCMIGGQIHYSGSPCGSDSATIHVPPPPVDSLDNPETAERYRIKKEEEGYENAVRQEQERQQQERALAEYRQRVMDANRIRHEQAVEGKLDAQQQELKKLRRQQARDAALERQQHELDRIQRGSSGRRGLTCRPNGIGGLDCD